MIEKLEHLKPDFMRDVLYRLVNRFTRDVRGLNIMDVHYNWESLSVKFIYNDAFGKEKSRLLLITSKSWTQKQFTEETVKMLGRIARDYFSSNEKQIIYYELKAQATEEEKKSKNV